MELSLIHIYANPFTLGHLSLVERAAKECDTVHLFVLSEEASLVPFDVRWKLVTEGVAHLSNVICHPSGPYMISSATVSYTHLDVYKRQVHGTAGFFVLA